MVGKQYDAYDLKYFSKTAKILVHKVYHVLVLKNRGEFHKFEHFNDPYNSIKTLNSCES